MKEKVYFIFVFRAESKKRQAKCREMGMFFSEMHNYDM